MVLEDSLRVLVFYGVLRGVPESKNWFFIVKSMVWKKIKVRNSAGGVRNSAGG
jgi:hypothetical protein